LGAAWSLHIGFRRSREVGFGRSRPEDVRHSELAFRAQPVVDVVSILATAGTEQLECSTSDLFRVDWRRIRILV